MEQQKQASNSEQNLVKAANYLIAAILVLVPFHAFLTVWVSTFVGHFMLLRLWDEVLLALLVAAVGVLLWSDRKLASSMLRNRLVQLILAYAGITLLWGIGALALHQVTLTAFSYALIVNLRFLVWFLAVWIIVRRSDWLVKSWPKLILIPLGITAVIALLQVFVLPADILTHFGYGKDTFVPVNTLNQDSTLVRAQATTRGSNQFGAYLVAALSSVGALAMVAKRRWHYALIGCLALLALALTLSRSAWVAAVAAGVIIVAIRLPTRLRMKLAWPAAILAAACLLLGYALVQVSPTFQDLVLHSNDKSTTIHTSNSQHSSALIHSVGAIVQNPLGNGPGSSGQASQYNTGHPTRNPESLLLQIGEETGWLGLAAFLDVLVYLGLTLWRAREQALPLAMLASLVGLAVVSLVSYTWIDDTVAFVWWGLAAIAVARAYAAQDA